MTDIPVSETAYVILLSLFKPMHEFAIMQSALSLSRRRVNLTSKHLFQILTALLERGWIKVYSSDTKSRLMRMYMLTDLGKDILEIELCRLKELARIGDAILTENEVI